MLLAFFAEGFALSFNTVRGRMVLKTAEGISGIAEESPWVNRFVAQKRFLLQSWQAGASRPLACAVTHGLPRALARCPLTLFVLGLLVESVVASLACVLILTLLQGSRAAQLAARPCWRRLGAMRFLGNMHIPRRICISPRKPHCSCSRFIYTPAGNALFASRLLDIPLGAAL